MFSKPFQFLWHYIEKSDGMVGLVLLSQQSGPLFCGPSDGHILVTVQASELGAKV